MILLWRWKPNAQRATHWALKRLARRLAREYQREVTSLQYLPEAPAQVEALMAAAVKLTEVRAAVRSVLAKGEDVDSQTVHDLLRRLADEVTEELTAQPWDHHHAREGLTRTLNLLIIADAEITSIIRKTLATIARHIVIPSDLLYQAHHALFPAEQMLVAAGRRTGETTTLGAVFEVTGVNSGGHVRANPTRLGRALIAMDLSDTYLAAWLHSHPGSGPEATRPSSIDLNQHQDWIRDYSPGLLSAVVVADGWIRFWGTALETGQIEIEVVGSGVIREDGDGCLYRLAE